MSLLKTVVPDKVLGCRKRLPPPLGVSGNVQFPWPSHCGPAV